MQLEPSRARRTKFCTLCFRNSQEWELVFITNTLLHWTMTYSVCICSMNCSKRHSVIACIKNWLMKSGSLSDTGTPCTPTQKPSAPLLLKYQVPFPQYLQSLEWISSSLIQKGLKDSSYFLSFSLLECYPWRVSFCCCKTVPQQKA